MLNIFTRHPIKAYILVHAELGNFDPKKDVEEYSLHDMVWVNADYEKKYYEDKILVTGHTPTLMIDNNPNPGFVYKKNNHLAIDCGAFIEGGRLAAVCLETGEELYSSTNEG